jgi:hypothetical protein
MKKWTLITSIAALLLISVTGYVLIVEAKPDRSRSLVDCDHTNPHEVSDCFSVNVFHSPRLAHSLFGKNTVSLEQFLQSRKVMLPPSKTITSIEFQKAVHGFRNTVSGGTNKIQSSAYTYIVKSTDDFQPSFTLEIDIFKENTVYRVLRFSVRSE